MGYDDRNDHYSTIRHLLHAPAGPGSHTPWCSPPSGSSSRTQPRAPACTHLYPDLHSGPGSPHRAPAGTRTKALR